MPRTTPTLAALRRPIMIRDKYGRVWFEWTRSAFQLFGFVIERTEGSVYGIIIGWEADWLTGQTKKERCSRFVPSACVYNGVDSRHEGPWDFMCP